MYPFSSLCLQQTYLVRLANSPNNKDATHISRQLQLNSWDVIRKRCQSSWQECSSGLHNRQLNVWEARIGNLHCDQVGEAQPVPQGKLCFKRRIRNWFFTGYTQKRSSERGSAQSNLKARL